MEDAAVNENGSRGPVTPPGAQNNHNNYEEEPDLSAQQEMRTPSPVDDEFELMEQNNAIVNEVSAQFTDSSQENKAPTPPVVDSLPIVKEESIVENEPIEVDQQEEEGESLMSPESDEKKARKRKHGEEKSRKRRHSTASNEEKKKLEKLKELSFGSAKSGGQDTRRFNFRETDATPEKKSTPKPERKDPTPLKTIVNKERRDETRYRAETITHPVMKTFREIKTVTLAAALDMLFSINPQDVAVLSKGEMVEILDIMFDLNKRREKLTINRMRLTDEVRKICNTEIALLNDLVHLMNADERHFFEQLKQCPPSMDEIVPFDAIIAPTDIDLSRGTTRLHAVDLIPPPDTPLIGRHDSNWETFLKHIPAQMRGIAPPPMNEHQHGFIPAPAQQPPPNFNQMAGIPPSLASIGVMPPPQMGSTASMVVQNPLPIVSSSANIQQPPPNFQQPPPFSQPTASIAPATFSQPPPNLVQADLQPQFAQQPANFQQPTMVEMIQTDVPIVVQQPPIEMIAGEQGGTIVVSAPSMNVPPPQIQKPISSSIAQMDMSVPPPVFSMSSNAHQDQISPVTMFRNSLKPSLLSSLVGPPPSLNEPPPHIVSQSGGMSYLHQPPPSMGSSGSPQRYVSSMPPPGPSPLPLMSVEVKKPFMDKQRHGKSPYRSGGDKQRRGNRNQKHQRNRNDRKRQSSNQQELGELRASESPASTISQATTAAATVASSSVVGESSGDGKAVEGGDATPGSQ